MTIIARRAVLSFALLVFASAARPQDIGSAPPAATSITVGALKGWSLQDGQGAFANDGKTFGLGIDPGEVGKVLAAAGAPADKITVSVDALLMISGVRVLLFDAGLGPKLGGSLMRSLALTGVAPARVTDILITHTHLDHIGGLVDASGALAFPNATIHISAPEWTWLKGKTAAAALVATIAPKVATFPSGAEVLPGVTSVPIAGHTPGHTAYLITSGADSLIDIGDAAHSSIVSVAKPEWKVEFDTDRDLAARSRVDEIVLLASTGSRVFAPHFPYPGVGTIERGPDAYRWVPENPPR